MKLFVCGEDSPDPKNWSIWSEWCLVIAENKENALKLCDGFHNIATEISLNEAIILCQMPEPNYGRDL